MEPVGVAKITPSPKMLEMRMLDPIHLQVNDPGHGAFGNDGVVEGHAAENHPPVTNDPERPKASGFPGCIPR